MSRWIATTVSGNKYVFDGTFVSYRDRGGEERHLRVWLLLAADADTPNLDWPGGYENTDHSPWRDALREPPRVGDRIFLTSRDEWRVSTEITKIEEVEDD